MEDWTLSPEQMFFMFKHHNRITEAYAVEDIQTIRNLATSPDYVQLFGNMSFDEAYDRYEAMLKDEED